MAINELEGRYQYERPVRVVKRDDKPPEMDEDLRRLCLSLINLIKKRCPNDYKRILAEIIV